MLLIVKLDQGVRNVLFFFGKFGLLCFLETPVLRFTLLTYYRRKTDLHVYFRIRCFLYCWSCLNYVFSTPFFSLCKRLCKVFYFVVYRFICPFKAPIVLFSEIWRDTHFLPFFQKSVATISLFTFFVISSFAWRCFRTLCIITFKIFHFDVVLFLFRPFFSQVCFTLFDFFPFFFPSTKYGRIYKIRVLVCIFKSFLLSLLVTKASFLRKWASTLSEFSQNFQHLRN